MPDMLLTAFSPMRPPARSQRTFLLLVCALLLFAQYVGLAHALRHATNALPVQQQQVAYEIDQSGSRDFTAICALDAVLAQVLGAGPISAYSFSCEIPPPHPPRHAALGVAHFDSPTARSRGPPALI